MNEPECLTCVHHLTQGSDVVCQKHRFLIPIHLGPYLICVDWEHHRVGAHIDFMKDRYKLEEGVLYKYDLYSMSDPQKMGGLETFASSVDGPA